LLNQANFPLQEDVNILCKSDYKATFYFHRVITKADSGPNHEAFDIVNELSKILDPFTHLGTGGQQYVYTCFVLVILSSSASGWARRASSGDYEEVEGYCHSISHH